MGFNRVGKKGRKEEEHVNTVWGECLPRGQWAKIMRDREEQNDLQRGH